LGEHRVGSRHTVTRRHARIVAMTIGLCAAAAAIAGSIALTRGAARGQSAALGVATIAAGFPAPAPAAT
jgi:hypothetical protein